RRQHRRRLHDLHRRPFGDPHRGRRGRPPGARPERRLGLGRTLTAPEGAVRGCLAARCGCYYGQRFSVSRPDPPLQLSRLLPPLRTSLPDLPRRRSLPALPLRTSPDLPPFARSGPPPAITVSPPSCPKTRSAPSPEQIRSPPPPAKTWSLPEKVTITSPRDGPGIASSPAVRAIVGAAQLACPFFWPPSPGLFTVVVVVAELLAGGWP